MSHETDYLYFTEDKYTLFLTEEEYKFTQGFDTTGYGSWVATNASLAPEKTFRFKNEYNTLKIQPLTEATPPEVWTEFQIEHEPKIVPNSFNGDRMVFYAFFYSLSTCQIRITIENVNGQSVTSEFFDITPQTWSLVRSSELNIPPQTSATTYWTTIEVRSLGGLQHVHMAHPIFINSYGFTQNLFLREMITYIPRFMLEVDSEQSNPKFPMSRYADIGTAYADRGMRQADSFRYLDISAGYQDSDNTTKSKLVNPTVANQEFLPWLAQFVGVELRTAPGGTTPWGNLPQTWSGLHFEIDTDPDVSYSITSIDVNGAVLSSTPTGFSEGNTVSITGTDNFNGQFIITSISGNEIVLDPAISAPEEFTGTATLVDSSWIELESFDLLDANYEVTRRGLVSTARTGHNAGTEQAIIDAIKPLLIGNQTVNIIHDVTSSPWVLSITTLTSETPNGSTGVESSEIIDAVVGCKPMGFSVTHQCVAS